MISQIAIDRIVFSTLLGALSVIFGWMSVWSLRGRDTYLPASTDIGQLGPGVDTNEAPIRGRYARWLGVAFLMLALVTLAMQVRVWR